MRIGVFGGSFDPVHLGHLWIAEAASEALSLDEIRWVPAAKSPLKSVGPLATGSQRVTMLQLALAGVDRHVIDEQELHRGGVSYTVDTIVQLRREFGAAAELFLIMGRDSLASIREWHNPELLLQQAIPAVVRRGGEPEPDFSVLRGLIAEDRIQHFREFFIPMPLIEISSSDIRSRIASGRSIRFRTTGSVEAFIRSERLYENSL